ncbi:MAG: DUF3800 domain-containing protein [Candidatus Electryonea clarkiae]|nr:DUF3800 domain-containing protein [Candidatus Electryonea clarkiae]MDP8289025.1 DUF3800 domain-containing protein [Candidatus Electryonea clarkiae]
MSEPFNIYLDESCHLEHDNIPVMVLGAVWCPTRVVKEVSDRIAEIKIRHEIPKFIELKWSKLSPSKKQLYLDLVDYFFDDDDLHFRGILIPDKTQLNHTYFNQSHDTWYYKMCFRLLEPIIDPVQRYQIYMDIKDTRSEQKRKRLEEILRSARGDVRGKVIKRVQQIRSHEVAIMQLTDIIIGAIGYHNRGLTSNPAKLEVIRRIQQRSRWSLDKTTWLREPKLSLLRWKGREANNV